MSLDRFFNKLLVDKPVQRNNYFFQVVPPADHPKFSAVDPEELAWSYSTKGDEDLLKMPEKLEEDASQDRDAAVDTIEQIRLRVERETLRRLPRTGAVIFTIRTYVTPVTELAREPGVPGRMASAIRSWPDDVAECVRVPRTSSKTDVWKTYLGIKDSSVTEIPYCRILTKNMMNKFTQGFSLRMTADPIIRFDPIVTRKL